MTNSSFPLWSFTIDSLFCSKVIFPHYVSSLSLWANYWTVCCYPRFFSQDCWLYSTSFPFPSLSNNIFHSGHWPTIYWNLIVSLSFWWGLHWPAEVSYTPKINSWNYTIILWFFVSDLLASCWALYLTTLKIRSFPSLPVSLSPSISNCFISISSRAQVLISSLLLVLTTSQVLQSSQGTFDFLMLLYAWLLLTFLDLQHYWCYDSQSPCLSNIFIDFKENSHPI